MSRSPTETRVQITRRVACESVIILVVAVLLVVLSIVRPPVLLGHPTRLVVVGFVVVEVERVIVQEVLFFLGYHLSPSQELLFVVEQRVLLDRPTFGRLFRLAAAPFLVYELVQACSSNSSSRHSHGVGVPERNERFHTTLVLVATPPV